jgi:cyclase
VRTLLALLAVVCAGGLTARLEAQPAPNAGVAEVRVLHVRANVYMFVLKEGNITVQVGHDGVLVVDTGAPSISDAILAEIGKLSARPIRYIVNTDFHPEHTAGNENLVKAGRTSIGGGILGGGNAGAILIAHENVLNRMSEPVGQDSATPSALWPTSTFFGDRKDLLFNDEAVQTLHQPAAHTDGDSIVFFRRSDVISTGDIFLTTGYPVIDTQAGGTINGIVDALNRIIELTVPNHVQEGGTMVIPGRGRLCDEQDVIEYRDMMTIVRDRIQDMIRRKMTLEQVKAARPTLDFDARYGSDTGPWTTAMFVEAAFRTLSPQGAKPSGGRQER